MVGNSKPYDKFRRISMVVGVMMIAGVWYFAPPHSQTWQGIIVFSILTICVSLWPVRVGGDKATVTINAPVHWAVVVLFGPTAAVFVAFIAFVGSNLVGWLLARAVLSVPEQHQRLRRVITACAGPWPGRTRYPARWVLDLTFTNAALEVTILGCAALTYVGAGGVALFSGNIDSSSTSNLFSQFLIPFAASLVAYFLAEEAVYTFGRICFENRPQDTRDWYSFVLRCRMILRESVPLTGRQYLLLPPITMLLVYLYMHVGFWSGLLVFGPFLSFRLSVQKAVEEDEAYMDTIATLGTYMQHYHPYTRGHLKRVADMSERIARELRLPAETVMLIPKAGLLHDIGKVGVSEAILDKTEKLTDEEWATIKEHPVKGAEIVAHLDYLDRTVNWIKYHHKWFNGAGYPENGIKSGEIPVEAAIIAVADAFDAMTDDREMTLDWTCDSCNFKPENGERPEVCPNCGATKRRTYRQPLSLDQAINELRRGAGSQFAPDVVKAFLRMVDREGIGVGGSN